MIPSPLYLQCAWCWRVFCASTLCWRGIVLPCYVHVRLVRVRDCASRFRMCAFCAEWVCATLSTCLYAWCAAWDCASVLCPCAPCAGEGLCFPFSYMCALCCVGSCYPLCLHVCLVRARDRASLLRILRSMRVFVLNGFGLPFGLVCASRAGERLRFPSSYNICAQCADWVCRTLCTCMYTSCGHDIVLPLIVYVCFVLIGFGLPVVLACMHRAG